jgi:predicted transcriptional regulator
MSSESLRERHEREKREDEARWRHYLATGEVVTHESVTAWLDERSRPRDTNPG